MALRIDARDKTDPTQGWVRRCWKCKEWRPAPAGYHRNAKDPKGIQATCKSCSSNRDKARPPRPPRPSEYFRQSYARNRDEVLNSSRAHYRTVRGRFLTLISAARCRARKRGHEHDLDIEWALSSWEAQKGRCAITGIPLDIETPLRTTSKDLSPFAPSLDRIDCDLGYTKANTRIVCVAANLAMNRFGADVFKSLLQGYAEMQAKSYRAS